MRRILLAVLITVSVGQLGAQGKEDICLSGRTKDTDTIPMPMLVRVSDIDFKIKNSFVVIKDFYEKSKKAKEFFKS